MTGGDLSIEILRGSATEEELAAVMAVVTEAYEREAESAVAASDTAVSAWHRSARAPRTVPRPGDRWSGFGG